MPAPLQPIKPYKCTFPDCSESFDSEKAMKSHKKNSGEHDYCPKCDEDFESYDDLAMHKAFRPDNHNKACRVCGAEFKSTSGLKRHIDLSHRVDQKLKCIGCGQEFYRASLLIEHLEFGHCNEIEASDFEGHIVHKHLIAELLKGGPAYERFMQKMSKYDASIDHEEEGGVDLGPLDQDNDEAQQVEFEAIKPDPDSELSFPPSSVPFPPLPSQMEKGGDPGTLSSRLHRMSISGESSSATVETSSTLGSVKGLSVTSGDTSALSSNRTLRAWDSRKGEKTSGFLFPNAKPTPVPSEFSISHHDDSMEQQYGINIMRTRFWDPISKDWNPERFYDSIVDSYYCPFICEQSFKIPADLHIHIIHCHRIIRMKCPRCYKSFKTCTALMTHCENPTVRCGINKAEDFNIFLDRLTGGFLGVEEKIRPDHIHNPEVFLKNIQTGFVQKYQPYAASYLQYDVTKPPDWKEPQGHITIGQQ